MDTLFYLDPTQPVSERVKDFIKRMTLDEKVGQMMDVAPAIERLGVPAYNWWNECLHGVARYGFATVFPQAIGLAATWNLDLMARIATAISDEARAKHHESLRNGDTGRTPGLTYWSPNINIFRDPRWGRGQETYGEDPFLTSRMGVTFIRGLQGEDRQYLKLVATPKHYAVHSGPEAERHGFDARVNRRDLYETYLPAFKACVQEGEAVSIMGAYNRTNGEPCCASPTLLLNILRKEWGFGGPDGTQGYVVSDCGAIDDIYMHHKVVQTAAEAAALAVNNGCELNCGHTYASLAHAVQQGLITEQTVDRALERLFTARFRLGMFNPPEHVPYAAIPISANDSPEHGELALQAARESLVLLKNNGLLPLPKALNSIAVIGPNADDVAVLLGNYRGDPSHPVTVLQGIRKIASPVTAIGYEQGCGILNPSRERFANAVALAKKADVVIVVMGLAQVMEGEEGQTEGVEAGQRSFGDRVELGLPGVQEELLQTIHATGTPTVLVLLNGSAVAVNWADEHIPAILEAWYPGQAGGTAVAEALFGDWNPGGRLPVTFYRGADDLPPFRDYAMNGRTYRFFQGKPLYPFGYGLSYTKFVYKELVVTPLHEPGFAQGWQESDPAFESKPLVQVEVQVQNTGDRAGDEVVQLYLQDVEASVPTPLWSLCGFRRVRLTPGETQTVTFELTAARLAIYDDDGRQHLEPGEFIIAVGGCLPDSPRAPTAGVKGRLTLSPNGDSSP